jgi:glycosyltransferase involved in cell wall biosynthesis
VSDFIRRKAIDRGFPEDRLKLHYIGIDTKAIQPRPPSLEEPGLVVHVGRLVEKKGTIYLLRALAKIQNICQHARLAIIGDGPLRRSLEEEARSLGILSRCCFLGAQPHVQVLSWMRRASLVAVPSVTGEDGDSEGLPTVNFEAAACGVPVVAFDSGGIRELVKHQHSGLLIREKDTDELAESISLLLHDDEMRIKIGANGRDQVISDFDIRAQTKKLEDFYDDASRIGPCSYQA